MSDITVTRFAPSPTGYLHIGHAFSALVAWHTALAAGGRFILRIEDIDGGRCKPEFEEAIYEDLAWLGIEWDTPVRRQSEHMADYADALAKLEAEIGRIGGAPHGTAGPVYPGTCRDLSHDDCATRLGEGKEHAIRLRMSEAVSQTGAIGWHDLDRGTVIGDPMRHGDVVLARKDIPTSYHLAVTIDDALQGITQVTRGVDLVDFTDIQRVLQELLGLAVPQSRHHKLLTDAKGRRYAKRDRSLTIRALRAAGQTPGEVRGMVGFLTAELLPTGKARVAPWC